MVVVIAFLLLGLSLGLRIQSRLGALFLCLAGVAVVHVIFEATPRILGASAYGRRIIVGLRAFSQNGGESLVDTTLAVVAGVIAAAILQTLSEDRKATNWDPDKAIRKRTKREGKIRSDYPILPS
jgi:hypothetical protein